ncbi:MULTISPECIES: Fic family protein [Clavibacter]|uniref:Fic family protein n=2 Tax=Clavibacter TaxID=1573 RepID=A0A399NVT0_9MICO|nr:MULTISPECIES: Fic family protein [Clavibacter]KDP91990.1 Fic protein [Clavibacter cf. michiganensis LMG 26808]RII98265.1 Fic family protein [Clavibacter michiganensis]UKF25011.1 Fic family protein [Clavibacter sp. A6099]
MPEWPQHENRTVPWRSTGRRGPREDRVFSEVAVALPPHLADIAVPPTAPRDLVRARYETEELERVAGDLLQPLAGFLIRMESVASSRIEQVEASTTAFARALGGVKENPSAMSMVSAGRAITALIDASATSIDLDAILRAHELLMQDDPGEREHAGRVRDVQNWIGGSQHTPRGALYVPPPPELVQELLVDLLSFANRDDVDPIAQAAIVHAQFESIHPFTDGNGRIGRALIGAVLRRRGITPNTVLPVASALAADTDHYFGLLTAYRSGDVQAIITDVALCVEVAAREARGTARSFILYSDVWRREVGMRAGSATDQVLDMLVGLPVFTAEQLTARAGLGDRAAYRAIEQLQESGIITEVTERKRDRIYAVTDVLDEFEDLDDRIRSRITRLRTPG